MIKLVCIKYSGLYVTVGNVYDGTITPKMYDKDNNPMQKYIITTNDKSQRIYNLDQFMPLAEWREKQINEILE
jgi:hypothetical protein